nr:MAG TPA: hypothetical protein [Caudoviricetes sp.]
MLDLVNIHKSFLHETLAFSDYELFILSTRGAKVYLFLHSGIDINIKVWYNIIRDSLQHIFKFN